MHTKLQLYSLPSLWLDPNPFISCKSNCSWGYMHPVYVLTYNFNLTHHLLLLSLVNFHFKWNADLPLDSTRIILSTDLRSSSINKLYPLLILFIFSYKGWNNDLHIISTSKSKQQGINENEMFFAYA